MAKTNSNTSTVYANIAGSGGLIIIAPHPDDETLGCGGLIAQARSDERQVVVVIVSDGVNSHRGSRKVSPKQLREIRQQESITALGILGVPPQQVVFLDVEDGSIPAAGKGAEDIGREILAIARSVDADAMAVTWRNDPDPDHAACYAIARLVKLWMPSLRLLEYPICAYAHSIELTRDLPLQTYRVECSKHIERKKAAIAVYRSQTSYMIDDCPTFKPLPSELLESCSRPFEIFFDIPHDECGYRITRRIHQIYLVDGFGLPRRMPKFIIDSAARLQELYPGAEYRLWDGSTLRQFISENFDTDVLWAFDHLRPYAYKADLARYCLLYFFGGLYADLSMRALGPLKPPPEIGLVAFRDYDLLSPSWSAMAIGLLWGVPKRREFEIAISYIVENCRTHYYGKNPLYPTGPVLFGRALVAAMAACTQSEQADDQWVGVSRPLTPDVYIRNIAYIAPDHSLIAILGKHTGGDLTHLGAIGTNNYNEHWHKKTVYCESTYVWPFDDPKFG